MESSSKIPNTSVADGCVEGTTAVADGCVEGTTAVADGCVEGTAAVADGCVEGTAAVGRSDGAFQRLNRYVRQRLYQRLSRSRQRYFTSLREDSENAVDPCLILLERYRIFLSC